MPEIRVKLVHSEQELEDAFYVRREVFVKEQGIPLPLEQDEFDAVSQHIVAYDGDQPISAGRVRIVDKNVAKVDRVCVLPRYRRQQVGVRMMSILEDYVKDYDITMVKIHAQTHAVPFYETQDYKVTSPEFIDGGIPFRAMEKHFKK